MGPRTRTKKYAPQVQLSADEKNGMAERIKPNRTNQYLKLLMRSGILSIQSDLSIWSTSRESEIRFLNYQKEKSFGSKFGNLSRLKWNADWDWRLRLAKSMRLRAKRIETAE
jgi:hypothetical protein